MKTFLQPIAHRKVMHLSLVFVSRENEHYILGVYSEPDIKRVRSTGKRTWTGTGKDYSAVEKITISKRLYDAFIKESRTKHKNMQTS